MQTINQFLDWLQKHLKTDVRHLLHGGSWVLFAQVLVFILSFVLTWVFANLLDPETYGQYRFLMTAVDLLALASLPGMTTAIVRAVAKGHSGVIPEAVATRIKWGYFGALGAVIGASYYMWQGNTELSGLFILIALFVPYYQSLAVATFYHNGRKDYQNYTLVAVIRRAFMVISTIIAIIISKNIFVILGTYLISTTLINFILYRYTIYRFPLSTETDNETIPYGKKLSLMGFIGAISNQADKIALWYLTGPAQVAIYTITTSLPKEIASGLDNIGILALPKMAQRNKEELRLSLLRKTFIFFIFVIPIFILYIIMAPFIFSIFLPQYIAYVFYSQVATGIILLTPITLLSQYFQATANTRVLYISQFILPTVQLALYAILIPFYGVMGAIIAFIARGVVSGLILTWFFIKDKN